jgi:hypothetical protein
MADQNWAWFVIAGCALILRRGLSDKGAVVSSFKIAPGEQVLISVRDRHTPVSASVTAAAPDED